MSLLWLSTLRSGFSSRSTTAAFPRLIHLGIAAPGCVLGRRRRNDGGVDDGPRADSDAAVAQIRRDGVEQDGAQTVLLKLS